MYTKSCQNGSFTRFILVTLWTAFGAVATAPAGWRNVPPRSNHEHREHRVGQGEDPKRRLVENNALQPVLDEAFRVAGLAGLYSQPRFQGCQRAEPPEQSLRSDDPNGHQVSQPKPPAVDPPPPKPITRDDGKQTADDEQDDAEVQNKNRVGKKLVRHNVEPMSSGRALWFDSTPNALLRKL
jgi:hypothetical protein